MDAYQRYQAPREIDANRRAMNSTTGPRSEITDHAPLREGNGSSRSWQRTIAGRRYCFTAVLMPSGERRYFATQLEAGRDDSAARFACYWHPVLSWTVAGPSQLPADAEPLVILHSGATRPSESYLASLAVEYGADVVTWKGGSWSPLAGPAPDVYAARTVTAGWHVAGAGVVLHVARQLPGLVTIAGSQGTRTWAADALIEATPPSCPSPAHGAELADFGDCSECGATAPQLPAPVASAAETAGTIASACAFGWS